MLSCEKGDFRQTPDALKVHRETKQRAIDLPKGRRGRETEVEELYGAVVKGRPVFHDGRRGAATLEVCLGNFKLARRRQGILMLHQVPSPD
jgi:hypothetical protein